MAKLAKKLIREKLNQVIDPELNISIVDLGLVYGIEIKPNQEVKIKMTLTTVGCPLFPTIKADIENKVRETGAKKVTVNLVFDPPWTMDKMSPRGKAIMGI